MIEETIAKIEKRLRSTELEPGQRAELQHLLAELRRQASGAQLSGLSAEPVDDEDDPRSAVNRLESSLTAFEASHPQLIAVVNRISTVLANMGI